jgi:polysaccharide biosynthesis/export protein
MKYCNPASKLVYLFIFSIMFSCASSRKAVYFNNIQTSEFAGSNPSLEPVVQPNDLLSISVTSLNAQASEVFNAMNSSSRGTTSAASTTSQAIGYLVDTEGNIKFPFLGNIKAAGLTKKALQEEIKQEIVKRKLLVDPIVDIRYLNYKVSVLGEVAHPSLLTVPNEKITLLEALGLAGDLTIYARRDNVLLIREEEGKKKLVRLNLTSSDLFTSPYYYLKSNDIIYVEPNKSKIGAASGTRQWLPVILSALSLAVITVDRLTR